MGKEELVCPHNGKQRKLCCIKDCKVCFDKSFASSPYAKFWSKTNKQTARRTFKYCNDKFIFDCHECGHGFSMSATHVAQGHFCSYCKGDLLCNDNTCDSCFLASFASHKEAINWSTKNIQTARQVRLNSNKKYIFDCVN